MELKKLIESLKKDEEELVFDSFSSDDAFNIGKKLIDKAKENNVLYVINISLNRRQLFHFSIDGTSPDYDNWAKRKENTVYHFFGSSYRVSKEFELSGRQLYPEFGLAPEEFALSGGSFPVVVKGAGIVGAITLSGMPDHLDHQYIVDVVREYLNR